MKNIKLEGMGSVRGNIDMFANRADNKLKETVKDAAFEFEGKAEEQITINKSVITGTLRRSIIAKPGEDDFNWLVGANTNYAAAVEARKPYFQPTIAHIESEYPELITKKLRGAI